MKHPTTTKQQSLGGATTESSSSSPSDPPTTTLVGQPKWLPTESYSLLILIGSSFLYSAMACFVQLATRTGIPSTELVFLRGLFQGTCVIIAMFFYKDPDGVALIWRPFGSTKPIQKVVIARGAVGGMGFLFYYYTISALPIGDATALLSLNPVITVLAASLFLHEAIYTSHIFSAVISLVGSVLLAHPDFIFGAAAAVDQYPMSGYITALLGTCCGSAVFILIRTAGKAGVHVLQLLFSWCFFGLFYSAAVGMVLPAVFGIGKPFVLPTLVAGRTSWYYIWGVCILGTMAHFLMNYAARHAPAGLASIVRSTSIMWSYLLELLVFHQVPQLLTISGVILILLALAVIAYEKHHHISRQKEQKNKIIQQSDEADQMELQPNHHHSTTYGSMEQLDDNETNKLLS